jgi:DNA-binding winged helix-turn-helix (wHTH) protein
MDGQSRPEHRIYEFGGYRLDPLRRVLLSRDGAHVRLKPKVFDTLLYLVEHAGEALDKSTLVEAIWPNLVVEENNLNKNVSALRRALGEAPGDHRFIVTEPGRGYRFVAKVRAAAVAETPRPEAASARPHPQSSTLGSVVIGILVTAVIVGIASYALRSAPSCPRCALDKCSRRCRSGQY